MNDIPGKLPDIRTEYLLILPERSVVLQNLKTIDHSLQLLHNG